MRELMERIKEMPPSSILHNMQLMQQFKKASDVMDFGMTLPMRKGKVKRRTDGS